ncbi:MAG TPA: DUF4956 domain-containing protein [Gemmataceae bacterium]|nr:DUF4956 domain-containing protein [Gemmataceae bacterium]
MLADGLADLLRDSLHESVKVPADVLLIRLLAAFVMGGVSAGVYRLTTRGGQGSGFLGTLVILSVLIALVTVVIGNSLARAFSLVGALAIVRFRTVVDDMRDTAFVLFAVASGMSCGAGYLAAAVVAAPLVLLASWLSRSHSGSDKELSLVLRLGAGSAAEQKVQALLKERLPGHRLAGLETVRGGTALDIKYIIASLAPEEALALVAALNRIEGVQGVELKGS